MMIHERGVDFDGGKPYSQILFYFILCFLMFYFIIIIYNIFFSFFTLALISYKFMILSQKIVRDHKFGRFYHGVFIK